MPLNEDPLVIVRKLQSQLAVMTRRAEEAEHDNARLRGQMFDNQVGGDQVASLKAQVQDLQRQLLEMTERAEDALAELERYRQ